MPSLPLRISFVNTFVQKLADFFILGNFCKAVYRFVTKNALRTTVSNTQSVKLTCFEACSLLPHAGAQLNGLRQMHRLNVLAASEVCNRACHLQDAVMAAGAEVEQPIYVS